MMERLKSLQSFIFYLGLGVLFTHELDAMVNQEWLVLPLTSWLESNTGMYIFIAMHIPLFAIVVALVASENLILRHRSRVVMSVFLIIHLILHLLFSGHHEYKFAHWFSNVLIYSGAILGMLFLVFDSILKRAKDAESS